MNNQNLEIDNTNERHQRQGVSRKPWFKPNIKTIIAVKQTASGPLAHSSEVGITYKPGS